MSVEVHEEADGRVLVVNVSGQLTKEDYERFVPDVDRRIVQHGHVRILQYQGLHLNPRRRVDPVYATIDGTAGGGRVARLVVAGQVHGEIWCRR